MAEGVADDSDEDWDVLLAKQKQGCKIKQTGMTMKNWKKSLKNCQW